MKVYTNKNIPSEYCYIDNFTNTYFDLYNTPNPVNGSHFYRVFYNYNDNTYLEYVRTYNYGDETLPKVEITHSILNSNSNFSIFGVVFIIVYFMILLINIITKIFRKDSLFK